MSLIKTLLFFQQTSHYLIKSRKKNASIPDLQTSWAKETLNRFNIQLHVTGFPDEQKPLLFVGNHISYLDIALLMVAIPNVSFVAKKELGLWPIIGTAARAMNTIFVNRNSSDSRAAARQAVREGLLSGKRIVIFPSGTTKLDEAQEWRKGAFEVAKEIGANIQPFRLTYSPLRHSAYIDDDFFPLHLYNIAGGPQITARLEFHKPVPVGDPKEDCLKWQNWTKNIFN
jgi:lyso-ornithine lipid O-acyltransferase